MPSDKGHLCDCRLTKEFFATAGAAGGADPAGLPEFREKLLALHRKAISLELQSGKICAGMGIITVIITIIIIMCIMSVMSIMSIMSITKWYYYYCYYDYVYDYYYYCYHYYYYYYYYYYY